MFKKSGIKLTNCNPCDKKYLGGEKNHKTKQKLANI